jgi:hypothetical protein
VPPASPARQVLGQRTTNLYADATDGVVGPLAHAAIAQFIEDATKRREVRAFWLDVITDADGNPVEVPTARPARARSW